MEHKNLALELIKRLLSDEIKVRAKKNVAQARKFTELLESAIQKLRNRQIDAAKTLLHFIEMAKQIRGCYTRAIELGLTEEEFAFFEALEISLPSDSVGVDILKLIAHDLVLSVKQNSSIDWNLKESTQARMRLAVKRVLRKHGCSEEAIEKSLESILRQAAISK